MSWNELWKSRNDTDLRTAGGSGSTGRRWTSEITGYQHFAGRDQAAVGHTARGADARFSAVSQVYYRHSVKMSSRYR